MNITVGGADVVIAEATQLAAQAGITLDGLIEDALRKELVARRERKPFKLRDGSVPGRGLKLEVRPREDDYRDR